MIINYDVLEYLPLNTIILSLIILLVAYIVTRTVRRFLVQYFRVVAQKVRVSETKYATLIRLVNIIIWLIAFMILIGTVPYFNAIWITVFASAGIIGIVVGIAAQPTLGNLIAGVVIAVTEPFSIGDVITVNDFTGRLIEINFRDCRLESDNGDIIIVPNSVMAASIIRKHAGEERGEERR
ncbi:MAG: mechanosensitive ion channel domain-containing protein [Halobacteriota archaeon]